MNQKYSFAPLFFWQTYFFNKFGFWKGIVQFSRMSTTEIKVYQNSRKK